MMTLSRLSVLVLFIYIAEIVLGGALGLSLFGISIRKMLMVALFTSFAIDFANINKIKLWQLVFLGFLAIILLVWALILPLIYETKLSYAVAEVIPLTGLLLVLPMSHIINRYGAERFCDFANLCVAVVGLLVIIAWAQATFFSATEFSLLLKKLLTYMSGDDFALYIGPMPDGSYRVMWITCMFFPLMLAYKSFNRFNIKWSAFYLVAIYASGTRAFLYVSILIIVVSLLKRKPAVAIILILATLTLVSFGGGQLFEGVRLFNIASDLESNSARSVQFFSLLRLFADYPFFGSGFGAQADIVRSVASPYSYELTYVALLAKLGVVGITILMIAICFLMLQAMNKYTDRKIEVAVIGATFILMTATNPYLINAIGISILSFIIAAVFTKTELTQQMVCTIPSANKGVAILGKF